MRAAFMVPSIGTVCATPQPLSYFISVAITEGKSMPTCRTVMLPIMIDGVSHSLYRLPGFID